MLRSFMESLDVGRSYFKGLFWGPLESHIVQQIRLFPWFFDQASNDRVGDLVTKDELEKVITSFIKEKKLGDW